MQCAARKGGGFYWAFIPELLSTYLSSDSGQAHFRQPSLEDLGLQSNSSQGTHG